jgi:hypothetical protein
MNIIRERNTKWVSTAILTIFVLICFYAYQSRSENTQRHTPFTARYTETSTNQLTGIATQRAYLYHAVRGDGTISFGSLVPQLGYRRIRSRIEKKEVSVTDSLKLKTTLDYSYLPITLPRHAMPSDCSPQGPGVSSLGIETILNYTAYRYKRIVVRPDGTKREMTQWFAPDLQCWEIQQITRKYDAAGDLSGVFEKKMTEVTTGEPDDGLFAIRNDYAEVTPSAREKAALLQNIMDREGLDGVARHKIPPSMELLWKQQDEYYDSVMRKRLQLISATK